MQSFARDVSQSGGWLLLLGIPAVAGFVLTPVVAARSHGLAAVLVGSSLVVFSLVLFIGHLGGDERGRL